MVGIITQWDILSHPVVTIRQFGWRVFFKAIFPWYDGSFLSLLRETRPFAAAASNVPDIVRRCIGLELRAKRIYAALAQVFDDQGLVGPFFSVLADEEQDHADLLELCRLAAVRRGWKVKLFNPWQDYLPRLEEQMEAAEAAVYSIDSLDAALQLVIRIEASEINEVFPAVVAAADAAFVKRLKPFRRAMEVHMNYIVERLPELSPKLMMAVRELRAKFPGVTG
jgi:hypothetical protein